MQIHSGSSVLRLFRFARARNASICSLVVSSMRRNVYDHGEIKSTAKILPLIRMWWHSSPSLLSLFVSPKALLPHPTEQAHVKRGSLHLTPPSVHTRQPDGAKARRTSTNPQRHFVHWALKLPLYSHIHTYTVLRYSYSFCPFLIFIWNSSHISVAFANVSQQQPLSPIYTKRNPISRAD